MTNFELNDFTLERGKHPSPDRGLCAMEAVAWLEGLDHNDHPACTCPVIASYVRTINDNLDDEPRQRLVSYLPKLVGTVSPDHEQERAEYLLWQTETKIIPMVLDWLDLTRYATGLRRLNGPSQDDLEAASSILFEALGEIDNKGYNKRFPEMYRAVLNVCLCRQPPSYITSDNYADYQARHLHDAVKAIYDPIRSLFRFVPPVLYDAVTAIYHHPHHPYRPDVLDKIDPAIFGILDGLLAIGPGGTFSKPEATEQRARAYAGLVNTGGGQTIQYNNARFDPALTC